MDLVKSFPYSNEYLLAKSASVQPRTSPAKIVRTPFTDSLVFFLILNCQADYATGRRCMGRGEAAQEGCAS